MSRTEQLEKQPHDPRVIRLDERFMPFDPLLTIHEEPSTLPYVSKRTLLLPDESQLDVEFDAVLPDNDENPERLELEVLVGYEEMMKRSWLPQNIRFIAEHLHLAITDRTGIHIARSTFDPETVAHREHPLTFNRFDFHPSKDHESKHPPTNYLPLWLPVRHGGGISGYKAPMTAQFILMK